MGLRSKFDVDEKTDSNTASSPFVGTQANPAAAVNEPATSDAAEEKTEIKAKAKTVAKKHRVSKKAAANKE